MLPQIEVAVALTVNAWHEVTLSSIGSGSDALQVAINGTAIDLMTTSGTDTVLDLTQLDGPLYIGGHPDIAEVQVKTTGVRCMEIPPTCKIEYAVLSTTK